MRTLLFAILLAALAPSASAQGVYKYVEKDGRVIYTDDPKAGGGRAQRVEDATSVIPAPPPAPSSTARQLDRQTDERVIALDRAVEDIAAASGDLREAEARRLTGIEPVEGERQGRRYRPEYWERQQALEREVDAARLRLEEANARRNALR